MGRRLREHAEMFGPEFREARAESVELGGDPHDKIIRTDKGDLAADALIVATGTSFLRAGCEGEERFLGRGVSFCAVCDGAFYDGVPVAVIGGGNAAVEEALYLTRFASRVYVIHRRNEFRADKSVVDRALANPKIEPVLGCVVDEIAGDEMVERVLVRNTGTNETKTIEVEGVFVFVGQKPEIAFLDGCGGIKRSDAGWIITDDKMETSVEGVFAAGDVRDKFLRQVATAISDGATAAMAAYEYITNADNLNSLLFGEPHKTALLISSVDPAHQALARAVSVPVIDLYRSGRVRAKLGVKELPSMVEISDGKVIRVLPVSSMENVAGFLEAVR
ncbi:MAG: FAD-dependent oxidoreductase, partial [Synergistaceae bacterium]|nr:FAD-dependent oxidoreductase [Synergistaceae bacterium]